MYHKNNAVTNVTNVENTDFSHLKKMVTSYLIKCESKCSSEERGVLSCWYMRITFLVHICSTFLRTTAVIFCHELDINVRIVYIHAIKWG